MEKWFTERCSQKGIAPAVKTIEKKYTLTNDEGELKQLSSKIRSTGKMSVSMVADGGDYVFNKLLGLAISPCEGEVYYIPLCGDDDITGDLFSAHKAQKQISEKMFETHLKPLFGGKSILKIGHNIKNTMHFISKRFGKTDFFPYDDISVMSYCLDSSEHSHDLKTLSELFLSETLKTNRKFQKRYIEETKRWYVDLGC